MAHICARCGNRPFRCTVPSDVRFWHKANMLNGRPISIYEYTPQSAFLSLWRNLWRKTEKSHEPVSNEGRETERVGFELTVR